MKSIIQTALIIGLFLVGTVNSIAQDIFPSEKPTAVENALFGNASAIGEEWAVIAAPQEDINDAQSVGAAYFYMQTEEGWEIAQKVSPKDLPSFAMFGNSVAIEGNTAFISAVGDRTNGMYSGAVYVYTFSDTSWIQTQKLTASDARIGHRFGNSIDVSGNTLVVGAYQANGSSDKTGAAYVFEYSDNEWAQTQKVFATNGESNDYFGYTVEVINSSNFAVGAYNASGAAERSGAVFLYSKGENGFSESTVLFELEGSSSDLFGYSIEYGCSFPIAIKSVSGNPECASISNFEEGDHYLFVGAPGTNNDNGQTGSVLFYGLSDQGITYNFTIEESSSESNDYFGTSLSFVGAKLLVGGTRANSGSNANTGSVYSYLLSTDQYLSLGTFAETTDQRSSHFGTSISSFGNNLIITAPLTTNEEQENSGSAYFYESLPTSSEYEPIAEIVAYSLDQNYPNPFNPSTTIKYSVKEAGSVKITVFNLLGQVVQVLVDEKKSTGAHQITFNASNLASGMYFYRLEVNEFIQNKQMMLIK